MTQAMDRAIRLTRELFAAILVPTPILHTRNHVARDSGLISMQRAVVTNCMVLIIHGTATHFEFATHSRIRAEFWLEHFPGGVAGNHLIIDVAACLFKCIVPNQFKCRFGDAMQRPVGTAIDCITGAKCNHRMWSWDCIDQAGWLQPLSHCLDGHNHCAACVMDQICHPGLGSICLERKIDDHHITQQEAELMFEDNIGWRCFMDADTGGVAAI